MKINGFVMHEPNNKFGYFGWPTVARLKDNRLVVVASGFRFKHLCPFGKVVVSYSKDEGYSWTKPEILFDTPLDERDAGIAIRGDQVLVTTVNNTRAVQYDASKRYETPEDRKVMDDYTDTITDEVEEKYLGSIILISNNAGNSFDEWFKVPIFSPHGPIVLRDGRYFYVGESFQLDKKEKTFYERGIYYITSENGYSWSTPIKVDLSVENAERDYRFHEPSAIELKNGDVKVFIRVQDKDTDNYDIFTMFYTTIRNGKQITPFIKTNLIGSPPHLMRHSSGAIILSYGRRESPFGIRVAVSHDEGETFQEHALRDDGLDWDLGYASTIERKDGSLITVYYMREKGEKLTSIMYTIWRLEDMKI